MHMLIRPFPEDITAFDRIILEAKPEHMMLIPQLLDVLEASPLMAGADLCYVKSVGCGGLGITCQFEERAYRFFKEHNMDCFLGYGWGCTESGAAAAHRHNQATTKIGKVGIPLVRSIVGVFEPETNHELQFDQEGELCIHSPNLMMGYYHDEQMTRSVIRRHNDGKLWLHTGDLGTINEAGFVTVKGRMTRVIFVFPTAKIYPQAMESAVSKVEGVQEVVFCEVPDKVHEGFFLPVCFIVPDGRHSPDEVIRNVDAFCKETMPEYAWPAAIHIRDRLPLTRVGKPDIRKLEAELLAGNAE